MPTFEKRSGGIRAKIRIAGHPPESQTFPTKNKAMAWALEREQEIRDGIAGIVTKTFHQAIDQYIEKVCPTHKSGDNEAKRLKAIAKKLPVKKALEELSAADFSKFRDLRLTEVRVATVRKEMTILRSVLEMARRDWHWIRINPIVDVRKPPSPPPRKRLMQPEEQRRILMALGYVEGEPINTLSKQVAVVLLLALETAMRAGELLSLEWSRVHLDESYITLLETKNGDTRDVPLSVRAIELLKMVEKIDKVKTFTLSSQSLDALFRKAKHRCQIEGLTFHDSRATALTRLSKKLSALELARMVGHRDLKSLLIYYRETATEIAQKLG